MLAEIYLLKLEAAVRAAKEAATTASTSRFVPVTLPAGKASNPRLPSRSRHLPAAARRTPGIQNNSGLPQSAARKHAQALALSNGHISRHWRQRAFSGSVKTTGGIPEPKRRLYV